MLNLSVLYLNPIVWYSMWIEISRHLIAETASMQLTKAESPVKQSRWQIGAASLLIKLIVILFGNMHSRETQSTVQREKLD